MLGIAGVLASACELLLSWPWVPPWLGPCEWMAELAPPMLPAPWLFEAELEPELWL